MLRGLCFMFKLLHLLHLVLYMVCDKAQYHPLAYEYSFLICYGLCLHAPSKAHVVMGPGFLEVTSGA